PTIRALSLHDALPIYLLWRRGPEDVLCELWLCSEHFSSIRAGRLRCSTAGDDLVERPGGSRGVAPLGTPLEPNVLPGASNACVSDRKSTRLNSSHVSI